MPATFPGFSPKALAFLRSLEKNNRREWFAPRKPLFEEILREPMLQLIELLNDDLRAFAADHVTQPKKSLFRIYRDTRFSRDKTPYKSHIAAQFPPNGVPRHTGAGYYFHVSPQGVEIAAGMYIPGPEDLAAVRSVIADNFPAWRKLVESKPMQKRTGQLQGEKLTRVPKGFPANHPAADYLRMKRWYFAVTLPPQAATKPTLQREIIARFRAMTPVVQFLNAAAQSARREEEAEVSEIPKRPEPMF